MSSPVAAGDPGRGDPSLADWEFAAFQRLIHEQAGILLGPAKKALLVARLTRRLRELGLRSFGAYLRVLTSPQGGSERQQMLDRVCTNETQFFREPRHFELLTGRIFQEWEAALASGRARRDVRAWSAGCSTGEEPYSIAMLLLDRFPPARGVGVEVLASDLSTRVVAEASRGIFPRERARAIPPEHLRAFMLKGTGDQAGLVKVSPELASVVRFEQRNLNEDPYPAGEFDLIFCRNVLIYFGAEARARAVDRLVARLRPGGYLFLGHAESLHGLGPLSRGLRGVIPNVYVAEPHRR